MLLFRLGALLMSSIIFTKHYNKFLETVRDGNLEAVRSFVNGPHFKEEMLNTFDDEMQSPLYVAMDKGHVDVALELIKKNPDFNLLNKKNYESYLHLAIRREDLTPCLEETLKLNADPNIEDIYGSPLLHSATSLQDRSPQIINLLIQKGASTEMTDRMGCTAIHRAIENMNAAAVLALCENKANVEAVDTCNRSALHHALYDKNLDIIKALVEIGNADIEKKDSLGCTALSSALNNNSIDVAFYLLSRNADVNAVDIMGNSILEKALITLRLDLVVAILDRKPVPSYLLTKEEKDRNVRGIEGQLHTATLYSFQRVNTKLDEGPRELYSGVASQMSRKAMYSNYGFSDSEESTDYSEESSAELLVDSKNELSFEIPEKTLLDAEEKSKTKTISSLQAESESSLELRKVVDTSTGTKGESSMTGESSREAQNADKNYKFMES